MPQFFVSTAKGLSDVLVDEMIQLGISHPKKTPAGAFFEGNWEDVYRLNLRSRVASRILKPLIEFTAYKEDELYEQIINNQDFSRYVNPEKTFMIDASVKESAIHDQRFLAMKVKDAIVDQIRETFGDRPNIEKENPDVRFYIKGYKNRFSLAVDTSGDSLFMRGYRMEAGEAPLKENLAAALIMMTEWKKDIPIVDLTCGSGTILIEAAMMALNMAPGIHRRAFGFQKFKTYDDESWSNILDSTIEEEKEDLPFKLYGFDFDRKVIQKAKANARRAGVDHVIDFRSESIATVEPPCEKGIVIINPPYGTRMGEEDNLRDVYRDLGYTLKNRFSGWDVFVLSGNKDLMGDLKLKASQKHFVYNGSLECRFLKYTIK